MLRISQIKLNPEEPVSLLPKKIGQKLRIRNFQPKNWKIVKESIDAREKPRIRLIYTVDFDVDDEDGLLARASFLRGVSLTKAPDHTYRVPDLSSLSLSEEERPVIAGFGPCGMFAALILAEAGLRPVVLERGRDVDRRAQDVEHFWNTGELDTESNVQFGEGGAGTFSDGKLTTGCAHFKGKRRAHTGRRGSGRRIPSVAPYRNGRIAGGGQKDPRKDYRIGR